MDTRTQLIEHLRFFAELGVDGISADRTWRVRGSDAEPDSVDRRGPAGPHRERSRGPSAFAGASADSPEPWRRRSGPHEEPPASRSVQSSLLINDPIAPEIVSISRNPEEALRKLREELGDCTRCKLHSLGRRQIVWGVGNPDADLMFVGEGPGAEEDVQGIPFVGRAGQLLTKIIEAIGLTRDEVYIANVVKCRPPQNRNPEPDEIASCQPFLLQQIDAVAPRVIVALGSFAARTLLKTEEAISRIRGRTYDYRGAKLIPTFHPAYLLRNPASKREVWEDMKKVRSLLQDVDG